MKIAPTFTARTVLSNFGPWIVYGLVAATGHQGWAYLGGLTTSLCQIAFQRRVRRPKIMDGVSLLFFFAGAVSILVFHSSLFPRAGSVLIWSALAVVAWGSLVVGKPFTAEYARSAVPQAVWDTPGFRRVNVMIAQVWGVVFATNAAHAVIMAMTPWNLSQSPGHAGVWLQAVPYINTFFGIVFTNRIPPWASRQAAKASPPGGRFGISEQPDLKDGPRTVLLSC